MRNLIDELEIEARHADDMASAARYWMDRCQRAEQMLAVAVYAAGGVSIDSSHRHAMPELTLRWQRHPEDYTVRYVAVRGVR